jgi:hypothetical protein
MRPTSSGPVPRWSSTSTGTRAGRAVQPRRRRRAPGVGAAPPTPAARQVDEERAGRRGRAGPHPGSTVTRAGTPTCLAPEPCAGQAGPLGQGAELLPDDGGVHSGGEAGPRGEPAVGARDHRSRPTMPA